MIASLFVLATSLTVGSPAPAGGQGQVAPASSPDSAPPIAPATAIAPSQAPVSPSGDLPSSATALPVTSQSPEVQVTAPVNDIVVTARGKPPASDPLQNVNVKSFVAVQTVDRAVVGPVSMSYAKHVPSPIRAGVHNVLKLLEEPTVFVNLLLQHRVGKAGETFARVAINATLGVGGLVDVAKRQPFNLPHRKNGFADTMGFYGIHPGPYLYLPLIGSTTARDLTGRILDLSLLSTAVGGPFKSPYYVNIRGVMASIDDRVAMDADLKRLRDESPDGYRSVREYYLKMRAAEIEGLHGRKAPPPSVAPMSVPAVPAGLD